MTIKSFHQRADLTANSLTGVFTARKTTLETLGEQHFVFLDSPLLPFYQLLFRLKILGKWLLSRDK